MATWGWVGAIYGLVLAITAYRLREADQPIDDAEVAFKACLGYAVASLVTGYFSNWFWIQLIVPGLLLLAGYWLSGFFVRTPQDWLEQWLGQTDLEIFKALSINYTLDRASMGMLEALEAFYALDYVVIAAGAFIAASGGINALGYYWSLVLLAELACYAALPWLRSRPPRSIERAGVIELRKPRMRAVNVAILDRASVQVNTIPSGHVAGAVAAALGVMPVSLTAGLLLLLIAGLIAFSATVGRYHYAMDCVLGAVVALWAWLLV
jgi:hypothetical protein